MKSKIIAIVSLILMPLSTFAGDLKIRYSKSDEGKYIHRILDIVSQDERFEYATTDFTNHIGYGRDDKILHLRAQVAKVAQKFLDMCTCQATPKEDNIIWVNTFDGEKYKSIRECRKSIAKEVDNFIFHSVLEYKNSR